MSERRVLALDFDGVLWDSAFECYKSSRIVWEMMGLPAPTQPYERFLRGRWLVHNGREFGVLMRLIEDNPERDMLTFVPKEFQDCLEKWLPWVDEFGKHLFETRARYCREDPKTWQGWQAPYPAVLRALPNLEKRFDAIVVATTKDTASAVSLLKSAGISMPIYGMEIGLNKEQHMRTIAADYDVDPKQIYFVDDFLGNLHDAAKVGARCFLAKWGYTTPEICQQAAKEGFAVIDEGEFAELGRDRLGNI